MVVKHKVNSVCKDLQLKPHEMREKVEKYLDEIEVNEIIIEILKIRKKKDSITEKELVNGKKDTSTYKTVIKYYNNISKTPRWKNNHDVGIYYKRIADLVRERELLGGISTETIVSSTSSKIENVLTVESKPLYSDSFDATHRTQPTYLNDAASLLKTKSDDVFVVGRSNELDDLKKSLSESNIVIVNGVRGIGKTSLVLKYFAEYHGDYQHIAYTRVVHGDVKTAIINCFDNNGRSKVGFTRIVEDDEDGLAKEDNFRTLLHSLETFDEKKPLLIIDNANDVLQLEAFIEQFSSRLPNWKIIVTSIANEFRIKVNHRVVKLLALSPDDSFTLFRKYCDFELNEDVVNLIDEFKYHPLLVEFLAKQISSSIIKPDVLSKKWLKETQRLVRLENPNPELVNENNKGFTVVEYLKKLFGRVIESYSEEKKRILRFFSVMPYMDYSIDELRSLFSLNTNDEELLFILFEEGYLSNNGGNFSMHEIYQMAIQQILKPTAQNCEILIGNLEKKIRLDELDNMQKTFLDNDRYVQVGVFLSEIINFTEVDIKASETGRLEELLSEKRRIIAGARSENDSIAYSELLRNLAKNKSASSERIDAYRLALKSLLMKLRLFEVDNYEVAKSYSVFARAIANLNKQPNLAHKFRMYTLSIVENDSSVDETFKYRLYRIIGNSYRNLGQFDLALDFLGKSIVLFSERNESKKYNFDLITSFDNIGMVYSKLGKREKDKEKIKEFYSMSIAYREKALQIALESYTSKDHMKISTLYNNFGAIYSKLDELDKSEENYKKCLEIREKTLPEVHIKNSTLKNNISILLLKKVKRGDHLSREEKHNLLEEANKLCDESITLKLKIYRDENNKGLGPNYHNKSEILYHMAILKSNNNEDLELAEKFIRKAIEVKRNSDFVDEFLTKESEVLLEAIKSTY